MWLPQFHDSYGRSSVEMMHMSPVCLDRRARLEPYCWKHNASPSLVAFLDHTSAPPLLTLRRGLSFNPSHAYASYLRGSHDQCSAG
jgi:hypothetical protein